MSDTRPTIILDCDPGHDDAMAIIVAARHCNLLGITAVAGNAPLDRTAYNARVVRELLGLDVPVHAGAARPLVAPARPAAFVHGDSGLDGAELPAPRRPLESTDAVGFIVETCRQYEGDAVWLVPVGPLTNIALALRSAPDLARRIAGISLMGGGSFGNRNAVGEFNIWADPEAASVVFDYGGPLVMAGLDVTHQFVATPERIAAVAALGGVGPLLGDPLAFFSAAYRARHDDIAGAPIHDPLAVLVLTHPQLFQRRRRHVGIEMTGTLTRGMTVIDERTLRERPAPNCDVLTTVDSEGAFAILLDAIAGPWPM